jgi:hypothetical protein
MKRIVKGKAYNTETAERVGSWDNGYCTNDFNYCSEDIYRKRTGEFFLHGEGHAMSIYASHEGNSSGWGEQIIPLTYQEAQEWAEKHLNGDEYEDIFGEVSEDDSRRPDGRSRCPGYLLLHGPAPRGAVRPDVGRYQLVRADGPC